MKLRNRNVSDNKAITEENASSPFFRLPPELRLRIYELVLGGQTIHIRENYARGPRERRVLSHHLCYEQASEEEVQMAFDSSDAAWNAPATFDRHQKCYYMSRPGTLESSLLQSCRQIYNEANIVRYYSNTFSFQSDFFQCLKLFYRQVPARYRNAIRRLHLTIELRHGARPEAREWADLFQWADLFRTLSHRSRGLRRLYLAINFCEHSLGYDLSLYQPPSQSHIVSCMLQEAKMRLEIATVTIDEDFRQEKPYMNDFIWTMAQKQETSQYLRRALLCHGNADTGVAEEEP
ncbi:hypothetical protein BDR22DRAFT_974751 [Usnea florida]